MQRNAATAVSAGALRSIHYPARGAEGAGRKRRHRGGPAGSTPDAVRTDAALPYQRRKFTDTMARFSVLRKSGCQLAGRGWSA